MERREGMRRGDQGLGAETANVVDPRTAGAAHTRVNRAVRLAFSVLIFSWCGHTSLHGPTHLRRRHRAAVS